MKEKSPCSESGVWAVFQYYTAFIADEKTENTDQIWINLVTNAIDQMKQEQNRIMYQQQAPYYYPIPVPLDMVDAFQEATNYIGKK